MYFPNVIKSELDAADYYYVRCFKFKNKGSFTTKIVMHVQSYCRNVYFCLFVKLKISCSLFLTQTSMYML